MSFVRLVIAGAAAAMLLACSTLSGPSAAPTPASAEMCANDVTLKNPPRLTMSTDDPAFPPWFGGDPNYQFPMEPAGGSGWQGGEPYSMEGFEGGVSYSLANALGYEYDEIDWVHMYNIEDALGPGAKEFDVYIGHVAASAERAQNVDLSDPYFTSYQSLLTVAPNPVTDVTSVAGLKAYRLGALDGTSSADVINDLVQPDVAPTLFADMASAIAAVTAGEIDGLVADINFTLYLRDGWIYDREHKLPNAVIVGRFAPSMWIDGLAAVMEKGSAFTPCVNAAVAQIKAENFIGEYTSEYINTNHGVPDFR